MVGDLRVTNRKTALVSGEAVTRRSPGRWRWRAALGDEWAESLTMKVSTPGPAAKRAGKRVRNVVVVTLLHTVEIKIRWG
ncbi:hypothetical protein KCP78_20535 [Salmonella enterica subsp. enterica]|nr:hypothetical protein KCP78_20535 [Salmonella enterica subsp. enterica]